MRVNCICRTGQNILFEASFVDHYGPLKNAPLGYKHVLLIIDGYTKFVVFYPVKSTESKESINKLKDYFHHYEKSRFLITDKGTCFTSEEFSEFVRSYDVKHVKIAVGTPRANGQAEKVFRFLRSTLAKIGGSSNWLGKLTDAQFTINNTLNRSIGCSPARMLFGDNQKLLPKKRGPYEIKKVLRNDRYLIGWAEL